jgi:hypothetical protein
VSGGGRVEKSNARSLLLDRGELGHCEMMRVQLPHFCLAADRQFSAQFSPANDSAALSQRSALGRRPKSKPAIRLIADHRNFYKVENYAHPTITKVTIARRRYGLRRSMAAGSSGQTFVRLQLEGKR